MEEIQKLADKIHKDVEPILLRLIAIEKALIEENFNEEEFERLAEEKDELVHDIGEAYFSRYRAYIFRIIKN